MSNTRSIIHNRGNFIQRELNIYNCSLWLLTYMRTYIFGMQKLSLKSNRVSRGSLARV